MGVERDCDPSRWLWKKVGREAARMAIVALTFQLRCDGWAWKRSVPRDPSSVSLRLPPSPTRGEGNRAAAAVRVRLYTDVETHTVEAARRFGLVEAHWDGQGAGVK